MRIYKELTHFRLDPHFTVSVVEGEKYLEVNNWVKKFGDKFIEFYDRRYLNGKHGQFISRYYLSTLLENESSLARVGLDLYSGQESWSISPSGMRVLYDRIREIALEQFLGKDN